MFFPAISDMAKTSPVIMFLDGHKSHETFALVDLAKRHNIILFIFPPHTTHLLQPLDVGVFGPFKLVWSQEFKLSSMAARVDRLIFPSLLAKAWKKTMLPEHLIGVAGIHPLSRDAISVSSLKPSMPFREATPAPGSSSQPIPASQSSGPSSQPAPASQSSGTSSQTTPASQESTSSSKPSRAPSELTPVTLRVAKFFGELFVEKEGEKVGEREDKRHQSIMVKH